MQDSIYNHPKWYDLVYGSDWKAEFDFLLQCFNHYCREPVDSIFEPACGTGRLIFRLAKAGFSVCGNDLNGSAVDYCNRRLKRHRLAGSAVVGDMCDFRLPRPVDAAFNLVSSFRHIIGIQQAENHLACMANCLKPDGIYVLGFHLTPTAVEPTENEHWSATRGHLTINTSMNLKDRDWDRRVELYETKFDVYTPTRTESIDDIIKFQMYTLDDFKDLLNRVPKFQIEETYDFHFDFDEPVDLSDETEDVVFILRRIDG